MRNYFYTIILISGCSNWAFSQSQELKQLKLDIQKLAQLRNLLNCMQRGFYMNGNYYDSILQIEKTNFFLHKEFLEGLARVSPSVRQYKRIPDIFDCRNRIIRWCRDLMAATG